VLRAEILRGQYRPGERLPSERDLALRFGCNRGAVREAVKKLEQLGIADVRPGGARVVPLDQASLDVVGHLLDLEDPPDPDLVDQVLEAVGALMSATIRVALDRASDDELARACEIARTLRSDADASENFAALHQLMQHLIDASGNLVLQLVRRGLRTQFFARLQSAGLQPGFDPAGVPRIAAELARALERRDGAAAAEAMHSLWKLHRDAARTSLQEARSHSGAKGANGRGVAPRMAP
jgi:DNA-binding FadR family transcriptional regulator